MHDSKIIQVEGYDERELVVGGFVADAFSGQWRGHFVGEQTRVVVDSLDAAEQALRERGAVTFRHSEVT